MSDITHNEILKDFIEETKSLIAQMQEILQEVEEDITLASRLENYGQLVDRIMGGARVMAMDMDIKDPHHPIHKIADYTGICKAVGYKTSQLKENVGFYQVCVALLMDATDILEELIQEVEKNSASFNLKLLVPQTLIDRLKWVSEKFSTEFRSSVEIKTGNTSQKMTQDEIDKLMAKLGL